MVAKKYLQDILSSLSSDEFIPPSRKINSYTLEQDVVLDAQDVNALATSTLGTSVAQLDQLSHKLLASQLPVPFSLTSSYFSDIALGTPVLQNQLLTWNGTAWTNYTPNLSMASDIFISSQTNGQFLVYNSATSKWTNATITSANLNDFLLSLPVAGQSLVYTGSVWTNQTASLANLTGDTDIVTPVNKQVLVYTGTKWTNKNLSFGMPAIWTDVNISIASTNQLVAYNGTAWTNQTLSLASSLVQDTNIIAPSSGQTLVYTSAKWTNAFLSSANLVDFSINGPTNLQLLVYNGSAWINNSISLLANYISDVSIVVPNIGQALTYNGTKWINTSLTAASNLFDMAITSPAVGQTLVYNGTKWSNQSFALNSLGDVQITSASNNQLLAYSNSSSRWINTSISAATYLSDFVSVSVSPVDQQILAWQTSTSSWKNRTLTLASGLVQDVLLSSPTNGQALVYNGTNWVNGTAGGGGSIGSQVTNGIDFYNGTALVSTSSFLTDGSGHVSINLASLNTSYNLAVSGTALLALSTCVLGSGDQTSTPGSITLRGVQATGTNITGSDMIIQASNGTGSGGSGHIRFQTAPAQTSTPTLISWSTQTSSNTNTYSFSFNMPAGYVNTCMILLLSTNYASSAPTSVTYNSVALTNLYNDSYGNNVLTSIWYMFAPSTGSNTCTILFGSTYVTINANVLAFYNVNQTAGSVYAPSVSNTYTTPATASISTAIGDLVMDFLSISNSMSSTPLASQSTILSTNANGQNIYSSIAIASATSTTFSWAFATNTQYNYLLFGLKQTTNSTSNTLADALILTNSGNALISGYASVLGLVRQYQTITASASTTSLSSLLPYYVYVIGTSTHTLKLPSALTLANGTEYIICNKSTSSITINDGSNATLSVMPSCLGYFMLTSNSTIAGSWQVNLALGQVSLVSTSATSYTMTNFNQVVMANATSNAVTITLPLTSVYSTGLRISVKKTDASANTVTIVGSSGQQIDTGSSSILTSLSNKIDLTSLASAWIIV